MLTNIKKFKIMRKLLLFISILVVSVITYGQTPIVDENVDTYTAGTYFVQQAGAPWTTWSTLQAPVKIL